MMKKIQQKNRLRTTKHTQQSCKQSRGWNASSDGCPIETTKVLWWGSYTLCPRHPTSAARRPAAPVLSGFVWKITSRFHGLSWFIMVYHGLSWFIIIILGLYNVVSTSISRYTHHIFRAISGRSNNPIPWRYSVMVSGENWDLLNQSGDLTNSARRRSWDILGYIYWWFMVIHPMQWESYENIQPR